MKIEQHAIIGGVQNHSRSNYLGRRMCVLLCDSHEDEHLPEESRDSGERKKKGCCVHKIHGFRQINKGKGILTFRPCISYGKQDQIK